MNEYEWLLHCVEGRASVVFPRLWEVDFWKTEVPLGMWELDMFAIIFISIYVYI